MKVAIFCNEYPPKPHGGIGSFYKSYAQQLASKGHTVFILQFASESSTTEEENSVKVVSIRSHQTRHLSWLVNRLKLLIEVRRLKRSSNIDILEVPEYEGWFPFPRAISGIPTVVRLHQSISSIYKAIGRPRRSTLYYLELLNLYLNRSWIAVSKSVIKTTELTFKIKPSTVNVIYNPSNAACTHIPQKITELGEFLIFVGSISEAKGALSFARAATIIHPSKPYLKFVYAGAPTQHNGRDITEEIISICRPIPSSQLIFLGRRPHHETMAWISAAKITVLPSKIEALGLAAIESMQLGTPVIFTERDAGPEIIAHGQNGLLVNPDDAHQIAASAIQLIDDTALYHRISNNAKESATTRFAGSNCVDQSIAYYNQILANKS